jgi:hypothetical protein
MFNLSFVFAVFISISISSENSNGVIFMISSALQFHRAIFEKSSICGKTIFMIPTYSRTTGNF